MTTRSDSDECLAKNPQTSENTSTSRDGFSQDSLKVFSLPPLEKDDSVGETMSSEKQVKSFPFGSVLEKDDEPINSDSVEVSFSKEPEAMDVDCPEVTFSVSETTSKFLEGEEAVEADGFVVCVSEKKGQEDSDVQRLLEAEKRRLFAEVETGTIFRKETLTMASDFSKDEHQKVERVRVKDNAFVGRSVNIDLVDDTALLNVVPFSKKGKDHPKRPGTSHNDKDAPRRHKKHIGGKQDKGIGSTKLSETSGKKVRIVYSINQMKSMRYAHSAYQKKLWSDMYARLLPELVTEYEGLVSLRNLKTSKSNMRDSGIGPVSAVPRRNRVNIFVH